MKKIIIIMISSLPLLLVTVIPAQSDEGNVSTLLRATVSPYVGPGVPVNQHPPSMDSGDLTVTTEPFIFIYPYDEEYKNTSGDDIHLKALFSATGGKNYKPANASLQVITKSATNNNTMMARTAASLTFWYYAFIRKDSNPPSLDEMIPVKLEGSGLIKLIVNDPNKESASANSMLSITNIYSQITYSDFARASCNSSDCLKKEDDFSIDTTFNFIPSALDDQPMIIKFEMSLYADAELHAINHQGAPMAEATIDPILNFDQAAFDALMGENTFPLKDYYSIEFTKGINHQGNTDPIAKPILTAPLHLLLDGEH